MQANKLIQKTGDYSEGSVSSFDESFAATRSFEGFKITPAQTLPSERPEKITESSLTLEMTMSTSKYGSTVVSVIEKASQETSTFPQGSYGSSSIASDSASTAHGMLPISDSSLLITHESITGATTEALGE